MSPGAVILRIIALVVIFFVLIGLLAFALKLVFTLAALALVAGLVRRPTAGPPAPAKGPRDRGDLATEAAEWLAECPVPEVREV